MVYTLLNLHVYIDSLDNLVDPNIQVEQESRCCDSGFMLITCNLVDSDDTCVVLFHSMSSPHMIFEHVILGGKGYPSSVCVDGRYADYGIIALQYFFNGTRKSSVESVDRGKRMEGLTK